MRRRRFLVFCLLGAVAGCLELDELSDTNDSGAENTSDNVSDSTFIDDIQFTDDGEIMIHFEADHDTDGFSILHEYHSDPIGDSIVGGISPQFAGPIELPFLEILEREKVTYPTPTFQIQLLDGSGFDDEYFVDDLGDPSDIPHWDIEFDDTADPTVIRFLYNDPQERTTNVHVVIRERFNENNILHEQNHTGPFGELEVTESLSTEEAQKEWGVEWEAYRDNPPIRGSPLSRYVQIEEILDSVVFTVPEGWQDPILFD